MGRRLESFVAGGVVVLAIFLTYARAWSVPFIFDDHSAILDNPTICSLRPSWSLLMGPAQTPAAGRPLFNLSLALNYALGGLDPRGYHGVNIALHALSALLLLGIVWHTLASSPWGVRRGYSPHQATMIATAVALLWAVHPLNSEAVVYVTQRTELMAGFFYLLTLYCAIRVWDTPAPPPTTGVSSVEVVAGRRSSREWIIAAVVACAAGMASKEVMISAPLAVLLYDRAFVSGSFRRALGRSPRLYAGLALAWLILGGLIATGARSQSILLAPNVARDYLLTQAGVVLHYLRLCVWPRGLTISYDWPLVHSMAQTRLQVLVILGLLGGAAWALWRRPALGFPCAVFFMVLAPSSSVVPVLTEVAVERRMYLPLAAVAALVVVGGWEMIAGSAHKLHGSAAQPSRSMIRFISGGVIALVVTLGVATACRLEAYQSEISIWADAAAKIPGTHTPQSNLGTAYFRAGRVSEAIASYARALNIDPGDFETRNCLGAALLRQGSVDQAVAEFQAAVRGSPRYADAWYNLGNALVRQGRLDAASGRYARSLEIAPDNADAWLNLGNVHLLQKRFAPAAEAFTQVLRLQPQSAVARIALANALVGEGQLTEAALQFASLIEMNPGSAAAQKGLGQVQLLRHQPQEAADHFRRAPASNPDDAEALDGLGEALATQNNLAQALDCFSRASELRPEFAQARMHRDQALDMLSRASTQPSQ